MMRSPAPASGSRRPSAASRNTSTTSRKSQDSWDIYRSSGSSVSSGGCKPSSSSSGRNPVKMAAWAIGSCFGPPGVRSEKDDFSEKDFKRPSLTQSRSAYGSSRGSSYATDMRRSGKGIYSSNSGNTFQREPGRRAFTMAEIQKATKNFSPALKVGHGGSGIVYKGKLDDGTLIAVKRAKKNLYDNHPSMEFQSEIQTLARVEHLNLVRFYGYLEYEDEKIIVVEYVPNGTLREHLDCQRGKPLDLAARLDIAIDVAHAVTYLHMYSDQPIIHRDIKSSNILIMDNLRAKVADFGFSRLGVSESGVTHVSTQVKGTAGYLDPEYLRTYQVTEKSDVFSFGVLLVELLSGRRPIEAQRDLKERVTAKWAMKKFTEDNAIQILDPNLSPSPATYLAVEQILELVFQCLAPERQRRPSMRRCAEILWSIRKDYRKLSSLDSFSQPSYQRNTSLYHNKKEKS
ncbi:calmodulin-binding receptor-like cytoplasmic kinase 2 [Phoenix dactylifera]|uniref:non-specific serine/threonine protein kinase n=1 Tax=Phoenix dactylifera TaxID=42345 RepID=A0A8B7C8Y6_PHODC|nr:calmodulin-binding receptor-like cytoplasmic kinase 2 [Phoenix dactylifera]XP_038982663.1 calmodulin-binding receptor-like cytoplasmic kinase 2 [Phoenix dactylifera]